MSTLTFKDKHRNALLKKFHTLLGRTGIGNEGKEVILSGYGVESSRDLSVLQLIDVCNVLDQMLNPKLAELDKARKQLMASIGSWLRAMGVPENTVKIKAIACRASGRENFNDIPLEQLRSLYAAFNKKKKDLTQVEELTANMIKYLSTLN